VHYGRNCLDFLKLLMSSSYPPQRDGQSEKLNTCLETFLRCSVHTCPRQWHKWLPLAEYGYNISYHSALGYFSVSSIVWTFSKALWNFQ
jgi:hypothetical protein